MRISLIAALQALILPLISSQAISSVDSFIHNSEVVVSFNLPRPKIKQEELPSFKGVSFKKVLFDGHSLTKDHGRAALPYKSQLIEARPEDLVVEVLKNTKSTYKGLVPMPARKEKCRCKTDLKSEFIVDWKSYQNKNHQFYKLEFLGDYKGRPVSKLTVFPGHFEYGVGLHLYPKLFVRVKSKKGQLKFFSVDTKESVAKQKMLILYSEKLKAGASNFGSYKKGQGMEVQMFGLTKLGESAQKIKEKIKELYEIHKYDYAVIVGHKGLFPAHIVSTSLDPKTPSDLPYFLMGEEEDAIPDLLYSRLIADTNDEVNGQILKMKTYESRAYGSVQGFRRLMTIASNEGKDPSDEEYADLIQKPLRENLGIIPTTYLQKNRNSRPLNIVKTFDEGVAWVNYLGHGAGHAWMSIYWGWFFFDHVKDFKPGAINPVVIDVSCQNGDLSYSGRLGERFMNTKVGKEPVGAVAYYGGSVNISWHPPAVMAAGISEAVGVEGERNLGRAILKGQMHLLAEYDNTQSALENLRWYHLFGDPSLKVQLGNRR